jgi:molybdenum ABC transporter molybdate-binding protein
MGGSETVPVVYRRGKSHSFVVILAATCVSITALVYALYAISHQKSAPTPNARSAPTLLVYCAAGIRQPIAQIAAEYQQRYGVTIQLQYGGSNTLLSQIKVARTGDLFIAADESYILQSQQEGLIAESIPLASMHPVIAVARGNPKSIQGIGDLLREDVRTGLANPDQAAVGKVTRQLLQSSGDWEAIEKHVSATGVFKPTVPEIANDVKLGSIDAAIVWDSTAAIYPEIDAVEVSELQSGISSVSVGVLTSTDVPQESLKFARYLSARDRGLQAFEKAGFKTPEGDVWADAPTLTFYCGSVNRRAIEKIIARFEEREGVTVTTVYNGCGILTAQMKSMINEDSKIGFPDTYLACDRYYLENVRDLFQDDAEISDTSVVIAVPKGNPKNIQSLQDLTKPGMRVAMGQPEQCTIGVLTRQLLESEGIYEAVKTNVVTQTATSAMLIATVTTKSVDASLAYATDTRAESDKVDTVIVDSPKAQAIQPFAIARSSDHKQLARRLYDTILRSKVDYESAGFHFRADSHVSSSSDTLQP